MSVRPAKSVKLCNTPSATLFVQDEICLDDGAGNVSEAMRFRTLDPLTLATIAERVVDTLTGLDATGVAVACPCDDDAVAVTHTLALAGGVLSSTVNGVTTAVNLRGQLQTDAFGVSLGYLLSLT